MSEKPKKSNTDASVNTLRARTAALARHRPAGHPELIAAHRELTTRRIESVIRNSPPLTAAQVDRLTVVLRGGTSA